MTNTKHHSAWASPLSNQIFSSQQKFIHLDKVLTKQSYARAFAWSNESTFQKRGYIQYTYIVVLFHKTAKRLSITSLTHPLRLWSKIQSSIVRHNKMFVLVIPVILLQTKTEKKYEVSQTSKKKKNTKMSVWLTNLSRPFSKWWHKNHRLDYFTETNFPKASN